VKRFAFRLERLRELRERAERDRAAELGAAMREEQDHREQLARARAALERVGEQAANAADGGATTAGMLRNVGLVRDVAGDHVDLVSRSLEAASARVDEERERWGEARRDLRVLEKLKERRLGDWRAESSRAEQKETDEVARDHHREDEGAA